MIQLISFAFMCAIIGEVWTNILTEPTHIANPLYRLLDRICPTWLFKPLIGCERCFTGQLAMWSWLFYSKDVYSHLMHSHMWLHMLSHMMKHMFVVSASIYLVIIIHFIYSWIKKKK